MFVENSYKAKRGGDAAAMTQAISRQIQEARIKCLTDDLQPTSFVQVNPSCLNKDISHHLYPLSKCSNGMGTKLSNPSGKCCSYFLCLLKMYQPRILAGYNHFHTFGWQPASSQS